MDVCNYINSKDVRIYMEETGYKFSSPEAAFLVYHCDNLTLEERMQAWQEIIDTLPDEGLPARTWCEPADSFHAKLADYMELQNRKIKSFRIGDGYVYRYSTYERSYNGLMDWNDREDVFFSDYGSCANYCKKYEMAEDGAGSVRIYKCRLDPATDGTARNRAGGYIELSREWAVLEIDTSLAYDDTYTLDLDCMFDGMCFNFPTPFKRGDIVTTHGSREFSGVPFVFSYISTWDSIEMFKRGFHVNECPWNKGWEEYDKCRYNLLKNGDLTDMHVLGILSDQRRLYQDNILIVPTDLEYYTGELEGFSRQLKPLSLYERGEIDYELLVNGCFSIRAEEMAREIREDCILPYRREAMEKIGIVPIGESGNSNP